MSGRLPFLIEDITPHNLRVLDDPATLTHPNGVTGIATLEGADFDDLNRTHGVRLSAQQTP